MLKERFYPAAMLVHTDAPISRDAALKAVVWLKRNFGREIEEAVKGTAYNVDTICGIACQETAYFWVSRLERLTPEQVCARCVLDAGGDAPGTVRRAFPVNTSAFRKEYGDERTQMLIEEANKTRALRGYPRKNWVYKGYGIFQYDLQFVKVDPDFFFEKQWYNFSACLDRIMRELRRTWTRYGNLVEAIRAYNGSGRAAAVYAQNVVTYSGVAGEITETMVA
jgi:hypothetical protein